MSCRETSLVQVSNPLKELRSYRNTINTQILDLSPSLSVPFAPPKLTQRTEADQVSRRHHLTEEMQPRNRFEGKGLTFGESASRVIRKGSL